MRPYTHERVYRWNKKKKSAKVHIKYGSGVWCQIENTGHRMNCSGKEPPKDRKICICCIGLEERGKIPVKKRQFRKNRSNWKYREPDLAVLMGERAK